MSNPVVPPASFGGFAAGALPPELQGKALQTAMAINEQPLDMLYKQAMIAQMEKTPTFEQRAGLQLLNTLLGNMTRPTSAPSLPNLQLSRKLKNGVWHQVLWNPKTGQELKDYGPEPPKTETDKGVSAAKFNIAAKLVIPRYTKYMPQGSWEVLQQIQDPAARTLRAMSILSELSPAVYYNFLQEMHNVIPESSIISNALQLYKPQPAHVDVNRGVYVDDYGNEFPLKRGNDGNYYYKTANGWIKFEP